VQSGDPGLLWDAPLTPDVFLALRMLENFPPLPVVLNEKVVRAARQGD